MDSPGSPQAVKDGCKCPVEENNAGEGAFVASRTRGTIFAVDKDCPLHGFERNQS